MLAGLAPIPAYLVYGVFNEDLDTAQVLERVLDASHMVDNAMAHLKKFLCTCVSAHNVGNMKPYVAAETFTRAPPPKAREWAREKFGRCFPTLSAPITKA